MEENSLMNKILCLSGGMDSFIAYFYLHKPPTIYFHTKQKHSDKEMECVKDITKGKCIIDHSLDFSSEKDIYIPHRNLLFASRASVHAQYVIIAGLKDDMVSDKTPEAFKHMTNVLSNIGDRWVVVDSPFWNMTKSDICGWYKTYTDDAETKLNDQSISCYSGGDGPCFKCESCFRKACAMWNNGMRMPFRNAKMVKKYRDRSIRNEFEYGRNVSVFDYTTNWLKSR